MRNPEVDWYSEFISKVHERYENRYDLPLKLNDSDYRGLFSGLISELGALGQPLELVLLYVDWFFGFKSIRPIQSIALMFGVIDGKQQKRNEILRKFLDWHQKFQYAFTDSDGCFALAISHRQEITRLQEHSQVYGSHYAGPDHSVPTVKE